MTGKFNSLWFSVINQMIADAVNMGESKGAKYNRDQARSWLTSSNGDLAYVCDLAGTDPSYIRAKAKRLIAVADSGAKPTLAQPKVKSCEGRRHVYTWEGQTLTLSQWAKLKGIKSGTLQSRLTLGWSFSDAINRPKLRRGGGSTISRDRTLDRSFSVLQETTNMDFQ
jgi:hypothetical protein